MVILRESCRAKVEFVITRSYRYQCEWTVLGSYWDVAVTDNPQIRMLVTLRMNNAFMGFIREIYVDMLREQFGMTIV
jgi:hypothetical protein